MFDIFIKPKTIVLDCFTYRPYVYNYCKIDYGRKFLPEWWQKTEIGDEQGFNIKMCRGLMDFYKKGIIIPSWFALKLSIGSSQNESFQYESSFDDFKTDNHTRKQFENFALENGVNFKVQPVWNFKTKKKIFFTWTQPTWSMRHRIFNFVNLPAVINFYNQHHAAVNFFFEYTGKEQTIRIEPLEPLAILHPMTEHKVEIKHHLVEEKHFVSMNSGLSNLLAIPSESSRFDKRNKFNISNKMPIEERLKFYKQKNQLREKIIDMAHDNVEKPFDYITEKSNGKQK